MLEEPHSQRIDIPLEEEHKTTNFFKSDNVTKSSNMFIEEELQEEKV
jgi:hypothetical protein